MTGQELIKQKNYDTDKSKRDELVRSAVNVPFESHPELQIPESVNDIKQLYIKYFRDYAKYSVLPYKKYIMAEFWFNDAGFHFKWRDHELNIQLECLGWNEVYKRLLSQ